MQKITPFLWFDDKAEEAMKFYVSIFKNSKIGDVRRYGKEGPGPEGTVMTATFELDGQEFMALNGGPQFTFSEAISFFVNGETQHEVDELWERLSAGGAKDRCGWLKGQVRRLLADRSLGPRRDVGGRGRRESAEGHGSDASDGQAGYCRPQASVRR